jgi:hypothetical protein
MIAYIFATILASHVHPAPTFRDRRVGMAGIPESAAEYARDARSCGFKVVMRRLRGDDLSEGPNGFEPGAQVVLFDKPYDRADPRAACFLKARKRSWIKSNHLHFPLPPEFRNIP